MKFHEFLIGTVTDVNGYPCLTKIGGVAALVVGLIYLKTDIIIAGFGALAAGKGLDAIVPKEIPVNTIGTTNSK